MSYIWSAVKSLDRLCCLYRGLRQHDQAMGVTESLWDKLEALVAEQNERAPTNA